MPVTAPADRRFRRRQVSVRRRAARRPWWRRALTLATALAVCAAGLGLALRAAESSRWLQVKRIDVSGNERIATGEVHALLQGMVGASLLALDLDEWQRKLLALRWVSTVAMRRVFPGTVAVRLTERRAIAVGRIDGVLYLIDDEGGVIEEYGPRYAGLNLPIVDGLAVGSEGNFMVDPERASLVARLFDDLARHSSLADRVSQVDVGNVHNVEVVLDGDTAIVRLGDERFAERLQTYLDVLPRLREGVPQIDYVDMRYDGRAVVGPMAPRGGRRRADGSGRS